MMKLDKILVINLLTIYPFCLLVVFFSNSLAQILLTFLIFITFESYRLLHSTISWANPQPISIFFGIFYFVIPALYLNMTHLPTDSILEAARYLSSSLIVYQSICSILTKQSLKFTEAKSLEHRYISLLKLLIIVKSLIFMFGDFSGRGLTVNNFNSTLIYVCDAVSRIILISVIIFCSNKRIITLLPFVAVSFLIDFMYASKALLLMYYIIPFALRSYRAHRLGKLYALGLFLLAILLFPITYAIKKLNLSITFDNLSSIFDLAYSIITDGTLLHLIIGRLTMMEPVARIFAHSPAGAEKLLEHFSLSNTIFPHFFQSFIPKMLYGERQDADIGRLHGYYFDWNNSLDGPFVSASVFGEFYINFGWYGLIATAFLAIFHSLVHRVFLRYQDSNLCVVFYYTFLIFMVIQGLEGHFVGRSVPFIKLWITFLAALSLWFIVWKTFPKKGA